MHVRIDAELCQGHQMCAIRAPELFGSDDEGYGTVLSWTTCRPSSRRALGRP